MWNKYFLLPCLFLFLFAASVSAQKTIRGRVTDAVTGEGLPVAHIGIVGSRSGTITNDNGEYQLDLPTTPEEWAEPEWVDFVCHRNAPWLSPRMRRRIDDFATVLGCRFPTVQDVRLPRWGKAVLSAAASWRWAAGAYGGPAELHALRRVLPLKRPEAEGL